MAIKCPKCQHENPDTSAYCSDCGTLLQSVRGTGPTDVEPDPRSGSSSDDIPIHTKTLETPFPQFAPGKSLANRYEIIKELGKGGMGEVYLAEDTNLKRQVAIKVLPHPFALDKERLARFEREARLLASLNHPNIATIHGLEKSEDQQFLVMELVEGDTLAERIMKGPLPVEEALEVCKQIAEGLESAHEKGIIHRDLKPSNVKVTPEGKVKILDFGLAKAFREEPAIPTPDLSKSPTLTDRMTRPGVIVGTAAYMSPEQARSHSVDKRTDIWAFGCVLYECLTGKPVLQGETVTDTLALILKGEPDWTKLPPNTPRAIRTLLRRCLQKDPKKRLRDIGDARIEIDEAGSPQIEESFTSRHFPWRWIFPICAACVLIGVLFGFLFKRSGTRSLSHTPVRSVIKTEPGYMLAPKGGRYHFDWPTMTALTISRDGRFIVYSAVNNNADSDAKPYLFMRRLEEQKATPIPGTEGGIAPFLSPDNRWIGFWKDQKLWKVQVDGGIPQELCVAYNPFGASWGEDGQIVFTRHNIDGLYGISSEGGKPEVLTEPDSEKMEISHRLPFHLPHGKGVLFTIMRNDQDPKPRIAVLESPTKERRVLLEDASDARYIPTGHILFLRRGTLMAAPFDLDTLESIGQPVPVIPDVLHMLNASPSWVNTASGQVSISESGSLIYVSGGTIPDPKNLLVWVDHDGKVTPASSQTKPFFSPRLSPDGKYILYRTLGTEKSLGKYDIDRDIHSTIISGGQISWPLFSPSGNEIVFSKRESKPYSDIFIKATKGDTEIKPLIKSQYIKHACSFSPDGNLLAYLELRNEYDILIYDFRDQSSTPFAATEQNEIYPEFSPNGRWIAYCTNEEGRNQVYVRHSSGTGEAVRISRDGGHAPLWARSGKKLFYLSIDMSQVWVSDVLDEKTPSFGSPRLLFQHETFGLFASMPVRGYDISLDDQRFLTNTLEVRQLRPVTEINLIQNWFQELKRQVPTGK